MKLKQPKFDGFWDIRRDPNLDKKTAKEVWKRCNFRYARIYGTKLYGCCFAEGIEREYKTEPVHERFNRNWMMSFSRLPTWKACQHCFIAQDILKSIPLAESRVLNHDA